VCEKGKEKFHLQIWRTFKWIFEYLFYELKRETKGHTHTWSGERKLENILLDIPNPTKGNVEYSSRR